LQNQSAKHSTNWKLPFNKTNMLEFMEKIDPPFYNATKFKSPEYADFKNTLEVRRIY